MTPRGLKLYVRPILPEDLADLRRLKGDPAAPLPPSGLLGRLLGETVSLAAFEVTPSGEMRIDELFVQPDLRRKQIGRVMIGELEQLASKLHCHAIVVGHECSARDFFLKLGFDETNSLLTKSI